MRNGMSVKEVYEALDQLDRIKESYAELQERTHNVQSNIRWAKDTINRTISQYWNVVLSPLASRDDKLEFEGKISGLREALQILDDTIRPVRLPEEMEDDEDAD